MTASNLDRLRGFVSRVSTLVDGAPDEAGLLERAKGLLHDLVMQDDWLPDAYAQPSPVRYQQYLLYKDPQARFSVVSFVWGPGQATPVHDHTVWGLVGLLRGGEVSQAFERNEFGLRPVGVPHRLSPGDVEAVSPLVGDIHRVENAYDDRVSISIHLYGADIGQVQRSTYDAEGHPKPFVSGYAPAPLIDLAVVGAEA